MIFVGPKNFGTTAERYNAFTRKHDPSAYIDTDKIWGNYVDRSYASRTLIRLLTDYKAKLFCHMVDAKLKQAHSKKVWIDTTLALSKIFRKLCIEKNVGGYIYLVDSIRSPGLLKKLIIFHDVPNFTIITTKYNELPELRKYFKNVVFENQRIDYSYIRQPRRKNLSTTHMYAADRTKQKEQDLVKYKIFDEKIKVFGRGWHNTENLDAFGWLDRTEYFQEINKSRLTYGIQNKDVGDLLTTRIIEIVAAGSLLLTDENILTREIFGDSICYLNQDRKLIREIAVNDLARYEKIVSAQKRLLSKINNTQVFFDDFL